MKQAMIFAAGLGTRLKPLTDTMPKALVRVGDKSLLQIQIEKLRKAGFERIVVNVHHFASQIIEFLKTYDSKDIELYVSDESECLLDTGGGLKHASPLFDQSSPVLIHNVDILSNARLDSLYEASSSADALLLVSKRPTSRYLLFDDEMRLVGWTNIKTNEIKSPYQIKDIAGLNAYAFSGIHCFSPCLFDFMSSWPDRFSIIDFYLDACSNACIRGVVQSDLRMLDVGKVSTLSEAESFQQSL